MIKYYSALHRNNPVLNYVTCRQFSKKMKRVISSVQFRKYSDFSAKHKLDEWWNPAHDRRIKMQ